MNSEKFNLSWNDFENAASNTIKDLLSDENFTDVALVSEDGKQVHAHKVSLSSSSMFFKAILVNNTHKNPLLYLKGVLFKQLSHILKFIYQGETELAQDDLDAFLQVAMDLEIKGLEQDESKKAEFKEEQPKKITSPGIMSTSNNHVIAVQEDAGLSEYEIDAFEPKSYEGNTSNPIKYERHTPKQRRLSHGVNKFGCNKCDKTFANTGGLSKHKKGVHEGVSYNCDQCEFRTAYTDNLARHKNKHNLIE